MQITNIVKCDTATCPKSDDSNVVGRALKRKFAELDGITQRLRLRQVMKQLVCASAAVDSLSFDVGFLKL